MHHQPMNGRTPSLPSVPDGILFHLAERQGHHAAQIDHLHTRVSKLEGRRPPFPWRELWPVLMAAIGFGLVLAGKLSTTEWIGLIGRG